MKSARVVHDITNVLKSAVSVPLTIGMMGAFAVDGLYHEAKRRYFESHNIPYEKQEGLLLPRYSRVER